MFVYDNKIRCKFDFKTNLFLGRKTRESLIHFSFGNRDTENIKLFKVAQYHTHKLIWNKKMITLLIFYIAFYLKVLY